MKSKIINILMVFVLLLGCKNNNENTETKEKLSKNSNIVSLTDKQAKNVSIETISISSTEMRRIEKVNGSIDVPPQNLASISCPTGGYLTNTKLLPGMRVSKGEAIATITDQQFIQLQQDYLSTKNKIHFAEIEYKRQKSLMENEATSDKALQITNSELQQNRILLTTIAEKLRLININPANVSVSNIKKTISLYSPINGFVKKVNVNIGKYVSPSEVLFEIINLGDIHLNLKVFERVAQHLKIGQRVTAYSNVDPSKKYDCEIILINKELDSNGTVDVHAHFEKYNPELIVGMYMNAEIETANNLQNALPIDCIVNFKGKSYIFVMVKTNTYEMIEVETGAEENGLVEIRNANILEGKKIVSKGAYTLLMTLKNIVE